MGKVTELIHELNRGGTDATNLLFSVVYAELHTMAMQRMARESPCHTLQPTALVNEAYLKLVKNSRIRFQNREHFFRLAARAMQRILIDNARQKRRLKRGRGVSGRPLTDADFCTNPLDSDLLDLNEALNDLELVDSDGAELVRLHFFAGLTFQQCAEVLDLSKSTAERRWRFARAWLRDRMSDEKNRPVVDADDR